MSDSQMYQQLPPDDIIEHVNSTSPTSISQMLHTRSENGEFYTCLNTRNLVAILPNCDVSELFQEGYKYAYANMLDDSHVESMLPPHPYFLAEKCYRAMMATQTSQTIVLTGNTGSVKSFTSTAIIEYLAAKSTATVCMNDGLLNEPELFGVQMQPGSIEMQVINVHRVLDAFTEMSDGTSRMAVHTQIHFDDETGLISGGRITALNFDGDCFYHLESETMFTIFTCISYHREDREKLHLESIDVAEQAPSFQTLNSALDSLFSASELDSIWVLLAVIVHLQHLTFKSNTDDFGFLLATISKDTDSHLLYAAELLGIQGESLRSYLTVSKMTVVDPVEQCRLSTGKLCESLYRIVLDFVISKLNTTINVDDILQMTLPHIDLISTPECSIDGECNFENFVSNTLVEVINHMAVTMILQGEQEASEDDGVAFSSPKFESAEQLVRLLLGGSNVDGILDIVKRSVNDSDQLISAIQDRLNFSVDQKFVFCPSDASLSSIRIAHTFRDVVYNLQSFVNENNLTDRMLQESSHVLVRSSTFLTQEARIKLFQLVIRKFLAATSTSDISMVFCFSAVAENEEIKYHNHFSDQIQVYRMDQIVQTYQNGFPVRLSFLQFFRLYDGILHDKDSLTRRRAKGKHNAKSTMSDLQTKCVDIIQYAMKQCETDTASLYQIGIQMVHMSSAASSLLVYLLRLKRDYWATEIQRTWRGFIERRDIAEIQSVKRNATQDAPNVKSAWVVLNVDDFTLATSISAAAIQVENLQREASLLTEWLSDILGCHPRSKDELVDGFMNLLSDGSVLISLIRKFVSQIPTVTELRKNGADEKDLVSVFLEIVGDTFPALAPGFSVYDLIRKESPYNFIMTLSALRECVIGRTSLATPSVKLLRNEMLQTLKPPAFERSLVSNVPVDIMVARRNHVRSLIQSEQRYLQTLAMMTTLRQHTLNNGLLPLTELHTIFGSVHELEDYHYHFVYGPICSALGFGAHDLEVEASDKDLDKLSVGDLFLDVLVSSDELKTTLLQIYQTYAEYVRSSRSLESKISTSWPEFFQMTQKFKNHIDFGAGHTVQQFLSRPLSRLQDYLSILVSIDQCTPSSHFDKEILGVVISRIEAMYDEFDQVRRNVANEEADLGDILDINRPSLLNGSLDMTLLDPMKATNDDTIRRPSKCQDVTAPTGSIDTRGTVSRLNLLRDIGELKTPWRKFICKGSVWEVINSGLVKERSLFLFNDILVIAKETAQAAGTKKSYVIKSVLELASMLLKNSRSEDSHDAILKMPVMVKALARFENNPRKGVTYLIDRGVLSATPQSVATFLYRTPGLNRRQIGKFIGTPDNQDILACFLKCFDFAGMRIDEAMRTFLDAFRLPGEPKVIDKLLEHFSATYFAANPKTIRSQQLVLKLVFATMMLNAEIHSENASGGPSDYMTKSEFVEKFKQHDSGATVSTGLLCTVYDSVNGEKLGIAAAPEDDGKSKIEIKMTKLPFRLTIHETSIQVVVSIPQPDAGLVITVHPHDGMRAVPSTLLFGESNQAVFRLVGDSLGRKGVTFIKSGASSINYDSLPQGKACIVEPPFMKHVLQIKARENDMETGKKVAYMFSVANESQRDNWCVQLDNVLNSLRNGILLDFGLPLSSRNGELILQDFSLDSDGAVVIPSDARIGKISLQNEI